MLRRIALWVYLVLVLCASAQRTSAEPAGLPALAPSPADRVVGR